MSKANKVTKTIPITLTEELYRATPLTKGTKGSAGFDLRANIEDAEAVIPAGKYVKIPTGVRVALPTNTEGQVRPRSGLAANHGVTVLNSPGTIDSDYRGEIEVILINHSGEDYIVKRGYRIAQFVVTPLVVIEEFESIDSDMFNAHYSDTERGSDGFGSTGVK